MDQKYLTYGSVSDHQARFAKGNASNKRPALIVLGVCVFLPWLLFASTYWVRSFELRYAAERHAETYNTVDFVDDVLVYCLLLPVIVSAIITFGLVRDGKSRDPLVMLTPTGILAWSLAFYFGDRNYQARMRPYYEISDLNVYPSVDPARYEGSQLMDAGMIQFTPGSRLWLERSVGFMNEDVHCVAPIHRPNSNQTTFDFWAVGVNCCSAHRPDFRCGEYTNPRARWGLRMMNDNSEGQDETENFRLAVKEAEAAYGLRAPHPVFLYWLEDPMTEVDATQESGYKVFLTWVFCYFSVQLFLVLFIYGVLTEI